MPPPTTSTAPSGTPGPSPGAAGEAEALQRRHLRGFLRWLLAFLAVFAVIDGVAAAVYHDAAIAICGAAFVLYAAHLALVLARLDRVPAARAALQVAAGLGATSLVVTLAYPDAAHGAALMPVAAAAMLLPYQAGPRLRRLMFLAGAAAVLLVVLGEVIPATTRAPAWLVSFYRLNSVAAGLLLVTVLLWQYQARWARLVSTLGDANQRLDERTAHLAAEMAERLRVSGALALRHLALEASPAGVAIASAEGCLSYVNPAFLRMWGRGAAEEVLGRPVTEFWSSPAAAAGMVEALRAGGGWSGELEGLRQDGSTFPCQVAATLFRDPGTGSVQLTGAFIDVTERRQAEVRHASLQAQLLQAQRLESVGRLAGGVAHDFNNLLTVMFSEVGLLQASPQGQTPAVAEGLQEIGRAAGRARDLTRQLLALGRRQLLELREVDLNQVVEGVGKMLARLIGEDVAVTTRLAPGLGAVRADPAQLEQVLLNLAVNARDAMPGGGRLTITTENLALGPDPVADLLDAEPGEYVALTVSDTGTGMDADTQAHAFEPFFTTKAVGKGTGLGLATVFGIVRQHGGHVRLSSEPGRGTTVRVWLPRVAHGQATAVAPPSDAAQAAGGAETVLVAEDEPAVRSVILRVLQGAGYRLLEADGAEQALRRAAEGAFDLLVTDVVMPGESGWALYQRLATARPGLRVLFMSGHAEEVISHHGVLLPGLAFLQKPFTPQALLAKVRQALDGTRPSGG